jgi:murein DD-endopeptidase MepM/ murein hydrolase activator NlpD
MKLRPSFFLKATLAIFSLIFVYSLTHPRYDPTGAEDRVTRLVENQDFQYPLQDYFPEIPMTMKAPPSGERYHAAEDCFAPAGTPVYAIGDGKISYSGKKRGYGWLIIVDHPELDVYSLYGHLSTRRWKLKSGNVKKGELIAYLGEASETDTQRPHIHFGLRLGQRKDYATIGNQRWMAGYTTCRPDQIGWLIPSKIIGESAVMREWNQLIQKEENIDANRPLQADDFRITSGTHTEKEDLNAVIKAEFGDHYRLAPKQNYNNSLSRKTGIVCLWRDSLRTYSRGNGNATERPLESLGYGERGGLHQLLKHGDGDADLPGHPGS